MDRKEIVAAAEAYWDEHRDAIVADIAKLVEIPSTEDLAAAAPGAPYGPGPAAALDAALEIAEGMGMTVTNCEGHIGFADLAGKTEKQLGIIGHVDVVPRRSWLVVRAFQGDREGRLPYGPWLPGRQGPLGGGSACREVLE